jgi:hypothetical protein
MGKSRHGVSRITGTLRPSSQRAASGSSRYTLRSLIPREPEGAGGGTPENQESPVPVEWSLADDILTLNFVGEYTFAEIAEAAQAGVAAAHRPVRLLVDATRTARLPDSQGVRQRIELLVGLHARLAGTVAIVASPGAMFGIARQVAQHAEGYTPMTIRVFEESAAARAWLLDAGEDRRATP